MDAKQTELNLKKLRVEMEKRHLSGYYISNSDPHHSEYVDPYFLAERLFYCPFTGTDGTLLVTMDKAYLFTDGRYFIQAEKELEGTSVELVKLATPGYLSVEEMMVKSNASPVGTSFDRLTAEELNAILALNVKVEDVDLSNLVENRPMKRRKAVWNLDPMLYDYTTEEKVDGLRRGFMSKVKAEGIIVTDLTDIAFLLNMRGDDIPHTPVFTSYLYIDHKEVHLFIDEDKMRGVDHKGIILHPYEEIDSFLKNKKGTTILFDPSQLNARLADYISPAITGPDPVVNMKALKGPKEINNIKEIHYLDGIAMVKFIKFLEEHIDEGLTEYHYAQELEKFRMEELRCYDLSFTTISAVGENAAQMHYDPSPTSSPVVSRKDNVLLVDSGGQYHGGTTDITRTFILHEPTAELRHDYTLTLKAVINLSTTVFINGCTGVALDIKAREIMWRECMDYKCGTGHGVGYMLSVHEGPQSFRYRSRKLVDNSARILPGMVTTVEPGVYKEGKYGIRIENELLCVPYGATATDEFFTFECLTCCPIQVDYLDVNLLTDQEIAYINGYHSWVYKTLEPYLEPELRQYLAKICKGVKR